MLSDLFYGICQKPWCFCFLGYRHYICKLCIDFNKWYKISLDTLQYSHIILRSKWITAKGSTLLIAVCSTFTTRYLAFSFLISFTRHIVSFYRFSSNLGKVNFVILVGDVLFRIRSHSYFEIFLDPHFNLVLVLLAVFYHLLGTFTGVSFLRFSTRFSSPPSDVCLLICCSCFRGGYLRWICNILHLTLSFWLWRGRLVFFVCQISSNYISLMAKMLPNFALEGMRYFELSQKLCSCSAERNYVPFPVNLSVR